MGLKSFFYTMSTLKKISAKVKQIIFFYFIYIQDYSLIILDMVSNFLIKDILIDSNILIYRGN